MPKSPVHPLPVLFALVVLSLVTGCSGMRLAYNNVDLLIDPEVADYLGLDRAQRQAWAPTLDAVLERHRADELPYLSAFFDSALTGARDGFTPARLDCLLDQFETLYQRNVRLASEAAVPLLAALTPAQVDALARRFGDDAREDAAANSPEAATKRARKRVERYEANLAWLIGTLDTQQRDLIREITPRVPDTAPAWYHYRDRKREDLITLLRDGAPAARISAFLTAWVVDYQDLPTELRAARGDLRRAFAELFLRLQPTLSDPQRERFIARLTTLRDDFLALQHQPRTAPTGC